MKKNSTTHQPTIGIDRGGKNTPSAYLVKDGDVHQDCDLRNEREQLEHLAKEYPEAHVIMELSTHSPWSIFTFRLTVVRSIKQGGRFAPPESHYHPG